MKKLVSVFACLFALLSIPMEGMAESGQAATRYYIDEVGVSLLLPENMTVVTRNSPAKERDYYFPYMIELDAYLYALAENNSYEVLVTVGQDKEFEEIGNLSDYDEEELMDLYEDFFEQPEFEGMFASQRPIYHTDEKTFMVFDCYQQTDYGLVNARMFFTIHEDKCIILSLNSLSGGYDRDKSMLVQQIAHSMDFYSKKLTGDIKLPTSGDIKLPTVDADTLLAGMGVGFVAIMVAVLVSIINSIKRK